MAFIPTPLTAKCTLNFTVDAQDVILTFYFEAEAEFDASTLLGLANALAQWAVDELLPLLSNGISLTGANATGQVTDHAPSVDSDLAFPFPGAVNSPTQAPQVAGVVTERTPDRGRSFRGRSYVPGIPTAALASPGTMGSTFVTNLLAAYGALADVEASQSVDHVVNSKVHNHAPRAEGVNTLITAYTMDTALDTQRRRAVGRGQ